MAAKLTADASCNYHQCEAANGHSVCPAVLEYVRALEKLPGAEHVHAPEVKQNGE